MKTFDGILICTDLDGTLLKNDKTVSRENLDAIEYFKSQGGYFTFITGRPPVVARQICETIAPNAPIGCINGGGLYDHATGEYLWYTELDRSVIELLDDVCESIDDIGFQVNTFGPIYFCRENSAMEHFRTLTGYTGLKAQPRDVREPFAKIVFGSTDETKIDTLATFLAAHPRADEFDFIRSEKTLYEILPKGINKGSVLPKLVKHLGIESTGTVAIGDYDNDVGMLRAAHVGIAVSNASPAAIAAADLITVSNEEHAIAKVISDIENGIITLR